MRSGRREQAAYYAGYAAAVESLVATAQHWADYRLPDGGVVRPMVLAGLREVARMLAEDCAARQTWACDQPSHAAPSCVRRAVELELNG